MTHIGTVLLAVFDKGLSGRLVDENGFDLQPDGPFREGPGKVTHQGGHAFLIDEGRDEHPDIIGPGGFPPGVILSFRSERPRRHHHHVLGPGVFHIAVMLGKAKGIKTVEIDIAPLWVVVGVMGIAVVQPKGLAADTVQFLASENVVFVVVVAPPIEFRVKAVEERAQDGAAKW